LKIPTPETEDLYIKSVNHTVKDCRLRLRQVGEGNLNFPNTDCDTGRQTAPGEYMLCDKTYFIPTRQRSKPGSIEGPGSGWRWNLQSLEGRRQFDSGV